MEGIGIKEYANEYQRENRVGKRKQGWEEKTRKIKNFDKTLEN